MRSFSCVTLTPSEFDAFSSAHPLGNFQQTSLMGTVREKNGVDVSYLGVFEDGRLVAATQLELHRSRLSTFAEIHDGPLCDFHDRELTAYLFDAIRERARAAGAAQVEVTPEAPYRIRTSAGDVLPEDPEAPLPAEVPAGSRRGPDDESLENLKAAGLVHEGFDRGYSAVPRWRYVKDLTGIEDEDALIASYNKKAKRDVRTARASFVSVERIGRDELPTYHHICELSCEKQGFENRPLAYFEQLFDTLGDAAEFFVAYLDVPAYLSSWEQKRDALLADIERYEAAIAEIESANQSGQGQYRSTKKVSRQMADAQEKYESSLRRIDDARAALDAHGGTGRIPAAAALFVWHERECVYLFSGSDQSLAAFCAPTLVQHKIMCECVERGCSRYNFYGIDGIFDPTSPGYGLIEFKQSFNGYIEELLGSFNMPVRPAVLAAKRLAHKILGR